jgi:deoxycytidine triphosphate deaminase
MSQLSAQSIAKLCRRTEHPMISPFSNERHVVNGRSWGLSASSYDVRIAHDLVLGPSPSFLLSSMVDHIIKHERQFFSSDVSQHRHPLYAMRDWLGTIPPPNALANTIEDFHMPDNVSAQVCDKSSFARVFVTAFNTVFDPGFIGNATLELVNLGRDPVTIKAGDPICQFVFHWLDSPTDRPYGKDGKGKYQHQPKRPVGPIYEEADNEDKALAPVPEEASGIQDRGR